MTTDDKIVRGVRSMELPPGDIAHDDMDAYDAARAAGKGEA